MKVAVLGLGNVGLNLLEIIKEQSEFHSRLLGERIEVVAAGDFRNTIHSPEGMEIDRVIYYKKKGDLWGAGYESIDRSAIFEKDIDILVDVTAATRDGKFGRDIYISSFRSGFDVATANKSPLANHWPAIMDAAEKQGRSIRFESTVAGGVPLFSFIDFCVNSSPVRKFRGIVNGTANFVLSASSRGSSLDEALEEARRIGIAEADPSLDIDGYDNAWKSLILANRLSDIPATASSLGFHGIREYIGENRNADPMARLISEVTVENGIAEINAGVAVLEKGDPLSLLSGDSLGYYLETSTNRIGVTGYNDGPRETAAGVMNDIILLARHRKGTS